MMPKQSEIWLTNLDPGFVTETGKTRPVLVVQTNLLNDVHPSVMICPITTNVKLERKILRVHLKIGSVKVKKNCDINDGAIAGDV